LKLLQSLTTFKSRCSLLQYPTRITFASFTSLCKMVSSIRIISGVSLTVLHYREIRKPCAQDRTHMQEELLLWNMWYNYTILHMCSFLMVFESVLKCATFKRNKLIGWKRIDRNQVFLWEHMVLIIKSPAEIEQDSW
jgi:hypothetical protein